MEFPRDPLREPGPDEHLRQRGGFQRLMAATTFESPFAKKKNKTTSGIGYSPLELDEVGRPCHRRRSLRRALFFSGFDSTPKTVPMTGPF